MPKVFGTIVPRNEHDYIDARHWTRRFTGTKLSAAVLGIAFASAAATVGAETPGQERGSFSALTNGVHTMVGWGHAGVQHVWNNAPTKENAIPYIAGAVAGGGIFIAKHMAVGALGSKHPYVTGVASVPVLHYVVDPLINTVLSYGEAPEAFHEGVAAGQSAVAFGALAVDLYAAAGVIKKHFQNEPPPLVDPAKDQEVRRKLEIAERVRDQAKGKYDEAQAVEGGMNRRQRRAAKAAWDSANNVVAAAEKAVRARDDINSAVAAAAEARRAATVNEVTTLATDAFGIAETETGAAVLSSVAGRAVSVPLGWIGSWWVVENAEDENDKEARVSVGSSGTSQPPSALMMPTLLEQGAVDDSKTGVAGSENFIQVTPQKVYYVTNIDDSDLAPEGYNSDPEHEGSGVSEQTAGDQSAMKDHDSGVEAQEVKAQQTEAQQTEAQQTEAQQTEAQQTEELLTEELLTEELLTEELLTEELLTEEQSAEKVPTEEQTGAKQVTEKLTDDEQSDTPQAEAAEALEQPEAPVVTFEASPLVHQAAIRPAAGSYNSNAWVANTMFQMNLSDRLNSYYKDESGPDTGNAWIRYSGSSIRQRDDSDQLYTKGDKNAVMMGVDMFMPSSSGRDRFTMGVMGGYGHYTGRTHSDSFDYTSVGRVDGYSVGLYGTYLQDVGAQQGLYADSWLLWNRFKNNVKGGDLPRENYVSKGVTASLELGYNFNLAERNNVKYVVQPHAQAVYQNVRAHDFREADGTRVDFLNGSRVQTAVGVRAAAHISTGLTSVVTPHIEVNWLHSTEGYGVRLGDAGSDMNGGRNAGQLKLGVQGDLNRQVSLNIELFHNQGNGGYRETGGNLVAKYRY